MRKVKNEEEDNWIVVELLMLAVLFFESLTIRPFWLLTIKFFSEIQEAFKHPDNGKQPECTSVGLQLLQDTSNRKPCEKSVMVSVVPGAGKQ